MTDNNELFSVWVQRGGHFVPSMTCGSFADCSRVADRLLERGRAAVVVSDKDKTTISALEAIR